MLEGSYDMNKFVDNGQGTFKEKTIGWEKMMMMMTSGQIDIPNGALK